MISLVRSYSDLALGFLGFADIQYSLSLENAFVALDCPSQDSDDVFVFILSIWPLRLVL